jgi:hypothetical protein
VQLGERLAERCRRAPARQLEGAAPAHQVADAEQPGPGRPEHHEPEDDAEQPVVRLHEDGLLHGLAQPGAAAGRVGLEELGRAAVGLGAIPPLERSHVVVHLVAQVARPEGDEQYQHGERELRQSEEVPAEEVVDQRDGHHRQRERQRRRRQLHAAGRAGPARHRIEIAVEPAQLAQVEQLGQAALREQGEQQGEQAHGPPTSSR